MRVLVLQHVPFEGLGSIEGWLKGRAANLRTRLPQAPFPFPDPKDLDFLIVLGGPMSVHDEDAYPWLAEEKRFLSASIHFGLPVLGICLGAQLIAQVMGGSVYKNSKKEIGWFPVWGLGEREGEFRFPPEVTAFHWHGETFHLPPGAVHLAWSQACRHQAFQIGRRVLGLQFHLETTPETANLLIENCRSELVPGENIQTEERIRAVPAQTYERIHGLMAGILHYLSGP
jgi:GMP synthase-like glutamine amidotransferase